MPIQIDDKPLETALLRFGAAQAIPMRSKAAIASGLLRASLRQRGFDVEGLDEAAPGSEPAQPDHGDGPSVRDPKHTPATADTVHDRDRDEASTASTPRSNGPTAARRTKRSA